jgi:hypothetical protein
MNREPEAIGGAPTLMDQRHVLGRECIVTHDLGRVGRRIEQPGARLRRKDFVFLHGAPLASCDPNLAPSVNVFDDGFSDI